MGLAVADYRVPAGFSVEDLVTRLSERTGERCQSRLLEREGQPDNYNVGSARICASVDLRVENGVLRSERMMPTSAYFDLQLELAVVELGGEPIDFVDGAPMPARHDHAHADLRWRELPTALRVSAGWPGRIALGLLAVAVNLLLILTMPLQLLFAVPIRRWQERRRAATQGPRNTD